MGSGENLLEKIAGTAGDAVVDNQADNFINSAIDAVASHVPGGEALEGVVKTGADLAANNAINEELSKFTGGGGGQSQQ